MQFLLGFLMFSCCVSVDAGEVFNPKLMKKVGECKTQKASVPRVYLIKQWHLSSSEDTRTTHAKKELPQARNQKEIYQQLVEWAKKRSIDTLLAEGCEGEIDSHFKEKFNGWTFDDLKSKVKDKNFSDIMTHVGLKVEVQQAGMNTLCGDNLAEVKKSNLALSDARADVGYLSRLSENKDKPEKLKLYLDGIIEAYQLPSGTKVIDAQKALVLDLKNSIKKFEDSTHERNLSFLKKIKKIKSAKPTALVIGGLHAQDLKSILEENQINCQILEPISYQNDEEALQQKLQSAVSEL